VREGDIAVVLEGLAKHRHADLFVLGTHGRRGLDKLLMGSVAEEVFRRATCPVLTIGPHVTGPQADKLSVRRILLPVDFTTQSLSPLPYAISLAKKFRASLTLLTVTEAAQSAAQTRGLLKKLRGLVPQASKKWPKPRLLLETGNPSESILRVATSGRFDLIVIGVRAVRDFDRAATHFPSVAHRILREAICPVLTVREK
jgi:nucleotide-binding universal stress UspA family protein